jgi:hypothetical protein
MFGGLMVQGKDPPHWFGLHLYRPKLAFYDLCRVGTLLLLVGLGNCPQLEVAWVRK